MELQATATHKAIQTPGKGESFLGIIRYWIPELLSSSLLFSLPFILDAYFVAKLGSTSTYGALGVSTKLLHTLVKLSEALMVASVAIIGRYNGAGKLSECGRTLGDTFWSTVIIGGIQFFAVFFGSHFFFQWIGTSQEIINVGVPFLKIQSFAVFLAFIGQAFLGFFRGVKNTKTPFYINAFSIVIFIAVDYILIFGKFGIPELGLIGSAIAAVVRFGLLVGISAWYLLNTKRYSAHFQKVFYLLFDAKNMLKIIILSIPVILDKTALASSYIWMCKMIAPLGTFAIAAMDVVQNLERFALLPAIAFAQIVTFLVSNSLGAQDPEGAKQNIKKVLLMATIFVATALTLLCLNAEYFVGMFDHQASFTKFASAALPVLAPLVAFDVIQLVLAGALRGAGDVKTVMITRLLGCGLFFVPAARLIHCISITDEWTKFVLIYGAFYLNTALMSLIFMLRIWGNNWSKKKV